MHACVFTRAQQPSRPPPCLCLRLRMCLCRSPAGEDVVPTFTTSNERMLLLLADGASGMLRVEDAERLQVGTQETARAGLSSMRSTLQA